MAKSKKITKGKKKPPTKSRQEASAENGKKGGRPTDYREDMPQRVAKYLKKCTDQQPHIVRTYTKQKAAKGKKAKETCKVTNNPFKVSLPTVAGLALYLDVTKDTLYQWAKKHTRFSDALRKLLQVQEHRLLNSGLSGDYNSAIAKLILSSNHNYAEKHKAESEAQTIEELLNDIDKDAKESK